MSLVAFPHMLLDEMKKKYSGKKDGHGDELEAALN